MKPVTGAHEWGSVPRSLPVFGPVSHDLSWPGRHPPNLSMTFLLVTSHSVRGQALGESARFPSLVGYHSFLIEVSVTLVRRSA
jgi:hypothetical protein